MAEARNCDKGEIVRLLRRGFSISRVQLRITSMEPLQEFATFEMTKGKVVLSLISTDPAALQLGWAVHPSQAPDGSWRQVARADNEMYWRDMEALGRDVDVKRRAALERVTKGEFRPEYDPGRLVSSFLRCDDDARDRDLRYQPLKQDYFDVWAHLLVEAEQATDSLQALLQSRPSARPYVTILEALFKRALPVSEAVWAYAAVLRQARVDLHEEIRIAQYQLGIVHDLQQMVAARSPDALSPRDLPHLLDAYRRELDAFGPLFRMVWELATRVTPAHLPPNASYWTIVERLRSTEWAGLVDCVHPEIRHSESHAATEIDTSRSVVILSEREEQTGRRVVLREYSFDEIVGIAQRLHEGLFPAMLAGLYAFDATILSVLVSTTDFARLVVRVGNPLEPTDPAGASPSR